MIRAGHAPGRIRATFPPAPVTAAAVDGARRRITGVAVPWGVEGRVSDGTVVVFEPGALDAAARPVALLNHDRARPIGVVADATDDGAELVATIAVDATADGDDALITAASGSRPALSVGAEPTRYRYDAAGVLHVSAADWQELSLLPVGAYTGARVLSVTASNPEGDPAMPPDTLTDDAAELELELEPDAELVDDDAEPVTPDAVTAPPTVPVTAGRGARLGPSRGARPSPYANVGIRQLARLLTQGRADERVARQAVQVLAAQGPLSIEAALADITLAVGANNVGALHRPAYQAELVELIGWGTPLVDALRQMDLQRGDYPQVTFNRWETAPTVGLQAAEKTEITSTPVKITPTGVDVETWAGGNDISQQTLDLGSPSFVEDYIRAAGIDYARKIDTYAVTTLMTAATAVTTTADDSFITIIGALVGALSPAAVPPGGLFCAVSQDVGVGLIGVPRDEGPAFWDGHVNFGRFTTELSNDAGLSVFVDPNMPARSYLLGHREGAGWWDLPGTPFNLRAVNVGLLGLDVAIYGYGALGIFYPGAFAKTTQPAPVP